MLQPAKDTYQFYLERTQYKRTSMLAYVMLFTCLTCALCAFVLSRLFWPTYNHNFTLYVKWQDAVIALLWFISFLGLGASVFVIRFLYALRAGYKKGMLTLIGDNALVVRDLSAKNLISIFWVVNAAFWCFVAALVGLLPEMLIGWTLQLSNHVLMVLATGVAIVVGLIGLVVSVVACSFIVIGCIGTISFCKKLGSAQPYHLSHHASVRIDDFVLTIIYPGTPETMVDLNLLDVADQRQLLALLRERWMNAKRAWNPGFGEEIEGALCKAKSSLVLV